MTPRGFTQPFGLGLTDVNGAISGAIGDQASVMPKQCDAGT